MTGEVAKGRFHGETGGRLKMWTTERPTAEGVFWLRPWDEWLDGPWSVANAYAVTVEDHGPYLRAWSSKQSSPLAEIDPRSLWAGPVLPPPA